MRAERARLDAHFDGVMFELATRTPAKLSRVQRRERGRQLERLEQYRRRRVFPKNLRFAGQVLPHFIDELGTPCAMAHLIEQSGERDLVQFIAKERNLDRIRDLIDLPELVEWLEAHGLTWGEAARIQPSYCQVGSACVCDVAAKLGAVQGRRSTDSYWLTVSAVYGEEALVRVGDVVPLSDPADRLGDEDIVFAAYDDREGAYAMFGAKSNGTNEPMVAVPTGDCALMPSDGWLPLSVVHQALSAVSTGRCESVLAAHDPIWGEWSGSCSAYLALEAPSRADDGGCALARDTAHGTEALLAVSMALVVYGARRRLRSRSATS